MFGGYQSTQELTQNLIDAGCDNDMIDDILYCLRNGSKAQSLAQLEKQRSLLLGSIHKRQASIEYVDKLLCDLKVQAV